MGVNRIPIAAAKQISDKYGMSQVILCAFDKETGKTHVVTYGKNLEDCEQAALGGNLIKRTLGFPEEMCNSVPNRLKK